MNKTAKSMNFQKPNPGTQTLSLGEYGWHRWVRRDRVITVRTLFLNAIIDGDKLRNCWGRLFHNEEYWVTHDVLGTATVIMDSSYIGEYGSGFPTSDAAPMVVSVKSTPEFTKI